MVSLSLSFWGRGWFVDLLWSIVFISFVFGTDHGSPGAGGTGQEAAIVLQGGAAHLGHVLWELRATLCCKRERETGPQYWHRLPNKVTAGAGTMNRTWDLCVSTAQLLPWWHHFAASRPKQRLCIQSWSFHMEGNNTACIYLFLFLSEGQFLFAGNSILCVHECAFAMCWRALQDSESKRRNRFILHSVGKLIWGWNRDLFNVAGGKPHVGRQC